MSAWCLVAEGPAIAQTVSAAGRPASACDRAAYFVAGCGALALRVFVPGALAPPAAVGGVVGVVVPVAPGACAGALVAPAAVVAGVGGVGGVVGAAGGGGGGEAAAAAG